MQVDYSNIIKFNATRFEISKILSIIIKEYRYFQNKIEEHLLQMWYPTTWKNFIQIERTEQKWSVIVWIPFLRHPVECWIRFMSNFEIFFWSAHWFQIWKYWLPWKLNSSLNSFYLCLFLDIPNKTLSCRNYF